MLQDTALVWGDNFVNNHPNYTFNKFAQTFCRRYHKVQMDEQVYMTLQIIKQNLNERVEEYYGWIFNLASSFQHSTDNRLLNAFLKVGLLPYLWVVTTSMERGTLIQHLEVVVIYEENFIDANGNKVILKIYPIMKGEKKKVEKPLTNASKWREECQYCKKFNH